MSGAGGREPADGEDRAAEAARRRREFIRDYHPDRGGDADSFIAGLRVFEAGWVPGESQDPDARGASGAEAPGRAGDVPARVVVVPHRAWLTRLMAAAVRRLLHGSKPARVR